MLGSQILAQWESRILVFVRIWACTVHPRCFSSRLGHWTCLCWAPAHPPATTQPRILRLASVQRCLCSLRMICIQIIAKHPGASYKWNKLSALSEFDYSCWALMSNLEAPAEFTTVSNTLSPNPDIKAVAMFRSPNHYMETLSRQPSEVTEQACKFRD